MRASRGMGKMTPAKAPKGSWVKKAAKRPAKLKSAGSAAGEDMIPATKLAKAAKAPGKMGQRARLAKTLKGFK